MNGETGDIGGLDILSARVVLFGDAGEERRLACSGRRGKVGSVIARGCEEKSRVVVDILDRGGRMMWVGEVLHQCYMVEEVGLASVSLYRCCYISIGAARARATLESLGPNCIGRFRDDVLVHNGRSSFHASRLWSGTILARGWPILGPKPGGRARKEPRSKVAIIDSVA